MQRERGGELAQRWRQFLAGVQDRVLRACLPNTADKVQPGEGTLTIEVDSRFKKDYCLRKISKLQEVARPLFGEVSIRVTELPLVEEMEAPEPPQAAAEIVVVGLGAGGINALERMRRAQLRGVRLVAADTDSQVLGNCRADYKLQLGTEITHGRSTGGDVHKGRAAADELNWELGNVLGGAHLVFLACCLGGGTGTGAAPVLARVARERDALCVGVVTLPFSFEGPIRAQKAQEGLERLRKEADVLIVINNDRLLEMNPNMALPKAFEMADDVLLTGVQGISDLVTVPGIVNLDFADVAAVLRRAGTAMMGTGEAHGDARAIRAAKVAAGNPLLEGGAIKGARKVLLNVTGGDDLTLTEVTQVAEAIRKAIGAETDLTFGTVLRPEMAGKVHVTVIAADFIQSAPEEEPSQPERATPPRRPGGTKDRRLSDADVPAFLRRRES
ncbi:MAG: cell division protein FtsZ [Candidatus Bipolaricaulota bacterium]